MVLSAFANAETYSSNPYKSLEEKITAALSSGGSGPITVQDVKKTSAAGLLEVTLDNGLVLYATEQGDHFVVGDLYAIRKDGLVNLAEEKREQDRVALIDGIDLAQMIVFTPEGETRDYITVFTDVTCFYCQKLHKEVADLNATASCALILKSTTFNIVCKTPMVMVTICCVKLTVPICHLGQSEQRSFATAFLIPDRNIQQTGKHYSRYLSNILEQLAMEATSL